MSGTDQKFLPYGRQSIDEDDIAAVVAVLRGDWLTQGPAVEAFEQAFARRVGARHAVAVSNGTAALHLSMMALGIGPGDAVVVPSVTFLATANAVRYVGAEVAFADVDPDTGLLTAEHAEAACRRAEAQGLRVRALAPVHLAGQPADMAGLGKLAQDRGLHLVEDACHALGARLPGRDGAPVEVGACDRADLTAFSFHPVKTIASGEGGMVTVNSDALAAAVRQARSHGMIRAPENFTDAAAAFAPGGGPNPWYYEMATPGFNYRLTDIQAALGLSQMHKLDRFLAQRRRIVEIYDRLLAPLAPLIRPAGRVKQAEPGWHLYVALLDFQALGRSRAEIMQALKAEGIGTQVHYIPVHRQPYYLQRYGDMQLPGAQSWYRRCLSLPLHAVMGDGDARRVVAAIRAATGS